jgi:hypothetical protein
VDIRSARLDFHFYPYEQNNIEIENAIGNFEIPLGVAVNFLINGKDYLLITYLLPNSSGEKYIEYAKRSTIYVNNESYKGKGYLGVQSLLRDSVFQEQLAILKIHFHSFVLPF